MKKNDDGSITLSREELYEQVWQKTMRDLAGEYGLSDVGLKKICIKHAIPRPPQGHWIRREHGHKDRQAPLPRLDDPALQQITLRATPDRESDQTENIERVRAERSEKNRIVVPDRLRGTHPLVRATAAALKKGSTDREGLLWTRDQNVLPIRVSPALLSRALRLVESLIAALEKLGHAVKVETPSYGRASMYAVVDGETFAFSVRESLKQEPHVPTEDEKRWGYWHKHNLRPSGLLALEIDGWSGRGIRKRWSDGKKQQLENCLNDVLVSFFKLADEETANRREREEAERRREAHEAQRKEKLRAIQEEESRVQGLLIETERWHKSQQIRAYVRELRTTTEARRGAMESGSELAEWVEWATRQADRLDPTVEGPPSIIDEKQYWEPPR